MDSCIIDVAGMNFHLTSQAKTLLTMKIVVNPLSHKFLLKVVRTGKKIPQL